MTFNSSNKRRLDGVLVGDVSQRLRGRATPSSSTPLGNTSRSAPHIKQTTLTQIDFLARLPKDEDEDLALEVFQPQTASPLKRRKIKHELQDKAIFRRCGMKGRPQVIHTGDTSPVRVSVLDNEKADQRIQGPRAGPQTPCRARLIREIPSSQSPPDSPLTPRSVRRARDLPRSPLKERSTNLIATSRLRRGKPLGRSPALVIEDSFDSKGSYSPTQDSPRKHTIIGQRPAAVNSLSISSRSLSVPSVCGILTATKPSPSRPRRIEIEDSDKEADDETDDEGTLVAAEIRKETDVQVILLSDSSLSSLGSQTPTLPLPVSSATIISRHSDPRPGHSDVELPTTSTKRSACHVAEVPSEVPSTSQTDEYGIRLYDIPAYNGPSQGGGVLATATEVHESTSGENPASSLEVISTTHIRKLRDGGLSSQSELELLPVQQSPDKKSLRRRSLRSGLRQRLRHDGAEIEGVAVHLPAHLSDSQQASAQLNYDLKQHTQKRHTVTLETESQYIDAWHPISSQGQLPPDDDLVDKITESPTKSPTSARRAQHRPHGPAKAVSFSQATTVDVTQPPTSPASRTQLLLSSSQPVFRTPTTARRKRLRDLPQFPEQPVVIPSSPLGVDMPDYGHDYDPDRSQREGVGRLGRRRKYKPVTDSEMLPESMLNFDRSSLLELELLDEREDAAKETAGK